MALISVLIALICIFIISRMVGNVFFRERKSGACNDQAGLDLIWPLAGVYLWAASVFVRSHKMNTLRQTSLFAVSSSHTPLKTFPAECAPHQPHPHPPTPTLSMMLRSYLTSLHHHHLQAHWKDFMLLLLKAQFSSLAPSAVNCSEAIHLNCRQCKMMALYNKGLFYI